MSKVAGKACVWALLAAMAVGVGCTNSDTLNPGVVPVPLETDAVGGSGEFECVLIRAVRITLQPLDPDVQALLESGQVNLLLETVAIDFNADPCSLTANQPGLPSPVLPTGTYRIVSFVLANPELFDDETSVSLKTANCPLGADVVGMYADTIQVDANARIRMTVDVDAMEAQLMASDACFDFFQNITNILTIEID